MTRWPRGGGIAASLSIAFVVAVALVLGGPRESPTALAGAAAPPPPVAPGELIVRFRASADADDRREARAEADTTLERPLLVPRAQLLEVEEDQTVPAAIAELEQRDDVLYAEPNVRVEALELPDDPRFGELWGLSNTGQTVNGRTGKPGADIAAPRAWTVTTGSPGVLAAVIDTGLDRMHPDLADNAWTNPAEAGEKSTNGVDDDANGFVDDWRGWSFVNDNGDPYDRHSHGTHVGGTIGGVGANGTGITGVSQRVSLVGVKVLSDGGWGYRADIADGFAYAGRIGARVANASLGGDGTSQATADAIAASPRTLFVVAAGNSSSNVDNNPFTPCAEPGENLICVAATTNTDTRASFSSYGAREVDLGAPGLDVLSTIPGSGYSYKSGTSMASPHVAGAAALIAAAHPDEGPLELKGRLLASADPIPAMAGITVSGGRLNVASALDVEPPPPPVARFESKPATPRAQERATLDASASSAEGGRIVDYAWDLDGNGGYEKSTGSVPTVTRLFDAAGDFTIGVRVHSDAGGTATERRTVSVTAAPATVPVAALAVPERIVAGHPADLDASGSSDDGGVVDYAWDLNGDEQYETNGADAVRRHTFTTAGTRRIGVRVSDSDGNASELRRTLTVESRPPPVARFEAVPATPRVQQRATLDASASSDEFGRILGYSWDLDGNGTYEKSTGSVPTVTRLFDAPGDFTIGVQVRNDVGGTGTVRKTVTVEPAPAAVPLAALAVPARTFAGRPADLDASGSSDDGGIVEYAWDIDGDERYETTGTAAVRTHTFFHPGTYTIGIRVTDADGNASELRRRLTVEARPPPVARLDTSPATPRAQERGTLDASASSDELGRIVDYAWDLDGNGSYERSTGTVPTVTRLFDAPGDVTIGVRVRNDAGASASARRTVTVAPAPAAVPLAALAVPARIVTGRAADLDASGSSDDAGVVEYAWDLDGDERYETSGSDAVRSHTFTSSGIYTVGVRVSDADGNASESRRRLTVERRPPPVARLATSPATPRVQERGTLDASASSDEFGQITGYEWDLDGNGLYERSTGTVPTVTRLFDAPGEVTIGVRVRNDAGATATTRRILTTVDAPVTVPVARLTTPERILAGHPADLDASASGDDAGVVQYAWDLDGDERYETSGAAAVRTHRFPRSGSYTVGVRASDADGNASELRRRLTVEPSPPVAAFDVDPAEPFEGDLVTFDAAASYDPDGTSLTYRWDLDGDSFYERSGVSVTRSYPSARTVEVKLMVTDLNGFNATATRTLTVRRGFKLEAAGGPEVTESTRSDGDGVVEPGESLAVRQGIANTGGLLTTGITGTLRAPNSDDLVPGAAGTWPDLEPGASDGPAAAVTADTFGSAGCGRSIDVTLDITTEQGSTAMPVTIPSTGHVGPLEQVPPGAYSTEVPPSSSSFVSAWVGLRGGIKDVDVRVDEIRHPRMGDVRVGIYTPGTGSPIILSDWRGAEGDDMLGTIFDSDADTSIADAAAPFGGRLRPDGSLDSLVGSEAYGGWYLYVENASTQHAAHVRPPGLDMRRGECEDANNASPTAALKVQPEEPLVSKPATVDASASTDPDGRIVKYRFDLDGDGTFETRSDSPNVERTFTEPGWRTVAVRVVDDGRAVDEIRTSFHVRRSRPPMATFAVTPSTPAPGSPAVFDATASNDPDGSIVTYEWDFDNDYVFEASGAKPQHTFTAPGWYWVGLHVVDDSGEEAYAYAYVMVERPPDPPDPPDDPPDPPDDPPDPPTDPPDDPPGPPTDPPDDPSDPPDDPTDPPDDPTDPPDDPTDPPIDEIPPPPVYNPPDDPDPPQGHTPRPPPPSATPRLTLQISTLKRISRAHLNDGIPVWPTCSRPCRVSAKLVLSPATARMLGLKKPANGGRIVLATIERNLAGGRRTKALMKLPKKIRRLLDEANRGKLQLLVEASDATGRTVTFRQWLPVGRTKVATDHRRDRPAPRRASAAR